MTADPREAPFAPPDPSGADPAAETEPPVRVVEPAVVADAVTRSGRFLVVLDDDPTGTQTVADIPVLTGWSEDDLRWAIRQGRPACYVLTNTRSCPPAVAADRNRQVVRAALAAGRAEGRPIVPVSRGDSTLRGHFPLETDVIGALVAAEGGYEIDGVLLCPAYLDAGRVTSGDVHWVRTARGAVPVADTEFARDATFGYRNSNLRRFVEEKTGGRWPAAEVASIGLADIRRGGPDRVAAILAGLRGGRPVVVNALCDDDLRVVALGAIAAERHGVRLLYRTGPSLVRSLAGLSDRPPLTAAEIYPAAAPHGYGLVVVGSHVSLTTRQLAGLRALGGVREIELDVPTVLDPARRDAHIAAVAGDAAAALAGADVVVRTSRRLVTGADAAGSLELAGRVSAAVVAVVRATTNRRTPRFVIAKGGVTASDVATRGLRIGRAWVRGTLLPGMVSLWSAVDGIAPGLPYAVFAGNVGDDGSLAEAVRVLRG